MDWHRALSPLTPLYRAVLAARVTAYRRGWKKSHHLPAPVISVGNLTFGGTGKTPTVLALVRDLVRRGRRPAVLTRGYGRESSQPIVLVGPNLAASPSEAGDEPLELASRLPGVPIVVNPDRAGGGKIAIDCGADVLVLDDGFQHLRLYRDLDLVLVDAGDPWGGNRLPPLGRLREPVAAISRASAVLVTKLRPSEDSPPADIVKRVRRYAPAVPVLGARLEAHHVLSGNSILEPDVLRDTAVFAFAGIGRPAAFRSQLERSGARVVGFRWFRDHHAYGDDQARELITNARELGATLVTTAKDAVKLPKDFPCWIVEVSMDPVGGTWEPLWQTCQHLFGNDSG